MSDSRTGLALWFLLVIEVIYIPYFVCWFICDCFSWLFFSWFVCLSVASCLLLAIGCGRFMLRTTQAVAFLGPHNVISCSRLVFAVAQDVVQCPNLVTKQGQNPPNPQQNTSSNTHQDILPRFCCSNMFRPPCSIRSCSAAS